uniref:Uncharacterized protein n=1 Tax=Arundo donax TaxID=35708 RepID=A0A0A9H3K0_ARUDO
MSVMKHMVPVKYLILVFRVGYTVVLPVLDITFPVAVVQLFFKSSFWH